MQLSTRIDNAYVRDLAYWLWQRRGMPFGSPDDDWLLAEALIVSASRRLPLPFSAVPLFAFGIERRTR